MNMRLVNYTISGLLCAVVAIGSIALHKSTGDPLYWIALVFSIGLLLYGKRNGS
jgi:hypothetical protein